MVLSTPLPVELLLELLVEALDASEVPRAPSSLPAELVSLLDSDLDLDLPSDSGSLLELLPGLTGGRGRGLPLDIFSSLPEVTSSTKA